MNIRFLSHFKDYRLNMAPAAAAPNAAPGTQWWYSGQNVEQVHQQNQAHPQSNQQHPQTNQHQAVCI